MEGFTLALGAAVVKSAAKLWLGDLPIAADASASAIDSLVAKLSSERDQRKLKRLFDQFEETVADRLAPLLEREFRSLDEGEQNAAVSAVRETLELAALTDQDLFDFDLDAGYLDRHLRASVPSQPERFALSEAGTTFYDRLLRECCGTLVEITKTLPRFQPGILTELLRRDTEILDLIREVLSRIPDRRSADDFEADYRQQVVALLDRMEFFGATVSESSRRYPLSVAYLSLSASVNDLHDVRIEDVLAGSSRLLIRGQAGAGKTTLLQWLAVRCAARDTPVSLRGWRDLLPFFIPLREYAAGDLPTPRQFLKRVGRHIADEMPQGWVQQRLRNGQAVVLIDGVDELPADRREVVRIWLHELVTAFPNAHYIVTSRPAAVESEWLNGDGFMLAELLPMTPRDARAFVHRWYEAMRAQNPDRDARAELDRHEQRLLGAMSSRSALRRIAVTPLLCALLCALSRDRHGEVPSDRMALYRTALEMLLGRYDEERGIQLLPGLFHTEQLLLLQDLAYWLVKNGESDAEKDRARERIKARLTSLGRVSAGPDEVLQYLLERTGLLREPVHDRVGFVHRTFQEYLAAKAAVDADDIGLLLDHAHLDEWREVIVLAAGHASRRQTDKLMAGLLKGHQNRDRRDYLYVLPIACLETAADLDPALRSVARHHAMRVVPPRSDEAIDTLVNAGEFVLDLLAQHHDYSDSHEAIYAIRTAARFGGEDAMRFLIRFASTRAWSVLRALVSASGAFELEEYAKTVLKDAHLQQIPIRIDEGQRASAVRHIRHLRRLDVVYQAEPSQLKAVAELERLTHLVIYNPSEEAVPLAEIAPLRKLVRLGVEGPSRDWAAIAGLSALRSLRVAARGHDQVEGLSGLTQLNHLELQDVADQDDLTCLRFLEAPVCLKVVNWSDLHDVSYLGRWAGTLTEVALSGCPVTDLAPLCELSRLRKLNLWDTGDERGLDLSPLARMVDLKILVAPDQDFRGAELLGPGSSVTVTG